jgi:hypothetical protein
MMGIDEIDRVMLPRWRTFNYGVANLDGVPAVNFAFLRY